MSQLKLTHELIDRIQTILVDNDADCRDPIVSAQYLAAIVGLVLGNQRAAKADVDRLFEQLQGFSRSVMDDAHGRANPGAESVYGAFDPGSGTVRALSWGD